MTDVIPKADSVVPQRNRFKEAMRKYRKFEFFGKDSHLDADIIDFSEPQKFDIVRRCEKVGGSSDNGYECLAYTGDVYELEGFRGFCYCPGALDKGAQLDLALKSVREYNELPHRTNIDLIPCKVNEYIDDMTIWERWKIDNGYSKNVESDDTSRPVKKLKNEQSQCENKKKPYKSFKKLSWSTMGYHYNWTARSYNEDEKSFIPGALDYLSKSFALCCDDVSSFVPSASIVNYYTIKSQMGGHRDDLELTFDKPVISISLGLPAIFLLGGKTKGDDVKAILVRSGDVMMLNGDTRLSFHGVAKVLNKINTPRSNKKNCVPTQFDNRNNLHHEIDAIRTFLQQFRININVRQVLPDGVTKIKCTSKT